MNEIRYAKRGGLHIAYRVEGSGSLDALAIPNWLTEIDSMLEVPIGFRFLRRLAAFSRIAVFDQPGSGLSDPIGDNRPTLEVYADSAVTVMDDIGMQRAGVIAWDFGAYAAIMLAATHADRVSHLVLLNATGRIVADDGYIGLPQDALEQAIDNGVRAWGTTDNVIRQWPSLAGDKATCEAIARYHRRAASPGRVRSVYEMGFNLDVRRLLPLVRAPTLIVHPTRSPAAMPMAQVEYLAGHIPNARLLKYDSADTMPHQEPSSLEVVSSAIEEFLTGVRPAPVVDDRVLATVLFTDIVGSTERASQLGDKTWSELLARHNDVALQTIQQFRGRFVDSAGDGLLATFDGPARAIRCARELHAAIGRIGLPIRAGLHTGEIEVDGADVRGIAVHIGARVLAMAGAGEILVSSTVRDLVAGSGIEFEDRGMHMLKGVPDEWRILAVKE